MGNVQSELIYGFTICWERLRIVAGEEAYLYWEHPVLEEMRQFARKHKLTYAVTGDELDDELEDMAVGIALWQVDEHHLSTMKKIEKAKTLFEERTQNSVLDELKKLMGHPPDAEADLHMMIEER